MNPQELDIRITQLLQKCSYSNDNFVQPKPTAKEKDVGVGISVVGDHNIIIDTGIVNSLFVFLAAYLWMCVLSH